jgi:hypothetical protein
VGSLLLPARVSPGGVLDWTISPGAFWYEEIGDEGDGSWYTFLILA